MQDAEDEVLEEEYGSSLGCESAAASSNTFARAGGTTGVEEENDGADGTGVGAVVLLAMDKFADALSSEIVTRLGAAGDVDEAEALVEIAGAEGGEATNWPSEQAAARAKSSGTGSTARAS